MHDGFNSDDDDEKDLSTTTTTVSITTTTTTTSNSPGIIQGKRSGYDVRQDTRKQGAVALVLLHTKSLTHNGVVETIPALSDDSLNRLKLALDKGSITLKSMSKAWNNISSKGFIVTDDGCIIPRIYNTKCDPHLLAFFGIVKVNENPDSQDEQGRPDLDQFSHLCHVGICHNALHVLVEPDWKNKQRNYCTGEVERTVILVTTGDPVKVLVHDCNREPPCILPYKKSSRVFEAYTGVSEEAVDELIEEGQIPDYFTTIPWEDHRNCHDEKTLLRQKKALNRTTETRDQPCPTCNRMWSKHGLKNHVKKCGTKSPEKNKNISEKRKADPNNPGKYLCNTCLGSFMIQGLVTHENQCKKKKKLM